MKKKHALFFHHRQWLLYILLLCTFLVIYASLILLLARPTRAEAVPGGNIADPVVRAVDIAKPAVVRITTTLSGQLTVLFPNDKRATFPLSRGTYQLEFSGSGAFISAHGDILTASHVIKPPHDASLNQILEQAAARDVADYINDNFNPQIPWHSEDALNALNSGYLLSEPLYDTPTSKVYLSTDYTGPIQASKLRNLPAGISAQVDKIKIDSPFEKKDLAIIHVDMDDTPSIPLADSSSVAQQDELTIIGFPANGDVSAKEDPTVTLTSSVNRIYVSALKRTDAGADVIQVGGNLEHGDSGGPALDKSGHIVGVASFAQPTSLPAGTAFLQTSNNAKDLISTLGLDLKPGNFQKKWSQAFSHYASTEPGHWHRAQTAFQDLSNNYPRFQAVKPLLTYTKNQASKEQKQFEINPGVLLGTAAICLAILITVVVLGVSASRRKRQQIPASMVQLPPARTLIPNGAPLPQTALMERPVSNPSPSPQAFRPQELQAASAQRAPAPEIQLPPATLWPPVSPQASSQHIAIPPAAPWPPVPNSTPEPRQQRPPRIASSVHGTPTTHTMQQQPEPTTRLAKSPPIRHEPPSAAQRQDQQSVSAAKPAPESTPPPAASPQQKHKSDQVPVHTEPTEGP